MYAYMNNKFGMFIHWGLYSIVATHEQALARDNFKHENYVKLIKSFNPTDYNPEEWVIAAKNAGMKYLCFTAKHHDGFCMWDTKYTDYNIMNTPYGKDVLKMLADACEKHGVLLSLYYSNPDWHHENGYNPLSTHQWKAIIDQSSSSDEKLAYIKKHTVKQQINNGEIYSLDMSGTEKYREYIKNQISELLTGYGKIYTLFWDIPPRYEDKSINELVRKLQPEILINDRGFDKGDFSTPEREIPNGTRSSRMTEACESVGEQAWGYRKNEDYHSVRYLNSAIDKVMAMGGNYLLNVGPMSNGKLPEKAADILKKVGNWYKKVENIIENNLPEKRDILINQTSPCVINSKNGKTYLHYYNGVCSSAITMTKFPSIPKKATLINNGKPLEIRYEKLPAYTAKDGTASGPYVSITDIPCDDFPLEPIVIEIEW